MVESEHFSWKIKPFSFKWWITEYLIGLVVAQEVNQNTQKLTQSFIPSDTVRSNYTSSGLVTNSG